MAAPIDMRDDEWMVNKARTCRKHDPSAARSWLIVARTLFPRNFSIQVSFPIATTHLNRLSALLSGSWSSAYRFVLTKRLWLCWFLRFRFCRRCRNVEFTMTRYLQCKRKQPLELVSDNGSRCRSRPLGSIWHCVWLWTSVDRRSCDSGVTTHTSRPCYGNFICMAIFRDVFLPICFWWKQSLLSWLEAGCMHTYSDASFYWNN